MAPIAPPVFWAQRSSESEPEKNLVLLTIEAPNLPPKPATKVDLQSDGFAFESKVQGDKSKSIEEKEYKFDLKLFGEIVPEESQVVQTDKHLFLKLRKKEHQLEYWPRLSKDKVRLHNVKTDFEKWVDEDEQDGGEDLDALGGAGGMGGLDPSMMGGMGGMGGMPGMGGMGGMGGGDGGMGGMDLQALMAQMQQGGGAGGMPDFGAGDDDDDDDDGGDDEGADADAPASTEGAKSIDKVD